MPYKRPEYEGLGPAEMLVAFIVCLFILGIIISLFFKR
jgi:hypothetical protein